MWRLTAAAAMAVRWLSLIILWSSLSSAVWAEGYFIKGTSGAFLGRYHLSAGYQFGKNHDLAFGLGQTPAIQDVVIYQLNLEYRYNLLRDIETKWPQWIWRPIQLYGTVAYAFNKEFFIKSPPQYPEDEYCEQTAFGFFLGAGSELKFPLFSRSAAFIWWVNMNDRYLVAKLNNNKWHTEFCCSSGIGLKMDLESFKAQTGESAPQE